MDDRDWFATEQALRAVLPTRDRDLARLRVLLVDRPPPTITVVGKYNHGKSRLLNELIGSPVFAVADRRETVTLADHDRAGLRWLDAPGLDADVEQHDDRQADTALWQLSDIRLFVHAAREGELDAAERALLDTLRSDAIDSGRQTTVVLTQIDQVADDDALTRIVQAVATQLDGMAYFPVSAARYRQGMDNRKPLLLARSGMAALQDALHRAVIDIPARRREEASRVIDAMGADVQQQAAALAQTRARLIAQQAAQRSAFDHDLNAVLIQAANDLRPLVDIDGPDLALQPDSFENQFRITPAKLERNRIQVAYSRVCIAINAVLTSHGVVGLPVAQRTQVASLNSVIVAVLGISVKFRADLRRLFCDTAGRQQLAAAFTGYFEQSDDHVALVGALTDHAAAQAAVMRAQACLAALARTSARMPVAPAADVPQVSG